MKLFVSEIRVAFRVRRRLKCEHCSRRILFMEPELQTVLKFSRLKLEPALESLQNLLIQLRSGTRVSEIHNSVG